jgi:hypothetical protein
MVGLRTPATLPRRWARADWGQNSDEYYNPLREIAKQLNLDLKTLE